MTALYCEIDPFAAAWLRELIKAGQIAPGDVTETPLEDLLPHDVSRYTQVHLCAGIGVWSYALRNIGWSDDRRIWSASFPCQPFSAAGKGLGFADERHLWLLGLHLIQQCRPERIVGEQVASKDGLAWLDVVFADLEASGYAVAAVDLCAAGVGAPHIRQRIWWVALRLADANGGNSGAERQQRSGEQRQQPEDRGALLMEHAPSDGRQQWRSEPSGRGTASGCGVGGVGVPASVGREGFRDQSEYGEPMPTISHAGRLADAVNLTRPQKPSGHDPVDKQRATVGRGSVKPAGVGTDGGIVHGDRSAGRGEIGASRDMAGVERPGPTNGLWREADWLYCRDGRWRPVEPGTFPLVNGAAARVGRLRGYGNAIVAPVAEEFLRAALLDELVNSAV